MSVNIEYTRSWIMTWYDGAEHRTATLHKTAINNAVDRACEKHLQEYHSKPRNLLQELKVRMSFELPFGKIYKEFPIKLYLNILVFIKPRDEEFLSESLKTGKYKKEKWLVSAEQQPVEVCEGTIWDLTGVPNDIQPFGTLSKDGKTVMNNGEEIGELKKACTKNHAKYHLREENCSCRYFQGYNVTRTCTGRPLAEVAEVGIGGVRTIRSTSKKLQSISLQKPSSQ